MKALWPAIGGVGICTLLSVAHFCEAQHAVTRSKFFDNPACEKFYRNLFARNSVDIRIVFGYKDARPARFVGDRYEELILEQDLLEPCVQDRNDCGFIAIPGPGPVVKLARELRGPDGKTVKIIISLIHSSTGPDDVSNRANPLQNWQSNQARRSFLEGIKNAEVVFYNGHSRLGGGPDFDPPVLDASGHVDYPHYLKKQPGLAAVLRSVAKANRLRVLGLFSCSADQHFSRQIKYTRSDLRIVTSDRPIYFSDALQEIRNELSNLLAMNCQKGSAKN